MNQMHEPSRRSTRVHCALVRLNLMVLDDTSNEVYHDDDDPRSYEILNGFNEDQQSMDFS